MLVGRVGGSVTLSISHLFLFFGVYFGLEHSWLDREESGNGREDVRAVAALYYLVLCLVVAQMGWGFGMSFCVGGAYLVDVVRRVAFVARRVWVQNSARGLRKY